MRADELIIFLVIPKINASRQVTVKVFYSICLVLDLLGENLAMSPRYS